MKFYLKTLGMMIIYLLTKWYVFSLGIFTFALILHLNDDMSLFHIWVWFIVCMVPSSYGFYYFLCKQLDAFKSLCLIKEKKPVEAHE
jgi:ABC-type multidrug transport system permease subunit